MTDTSTKPTTAPGDRHDRAQLPGRRRHGRPRFWALCVGAGLLGARDPRAHPDQHRPRGVAGLPRGGPGLPHQRPVGGQRPDGDGPQRPSSARWRSSTARSSSSVIALIFAVPVSIGIALFLTELAPPAPARPRRHASSTCWPRCRRWSSACGASSCVAPALVPVYKWFHDALGGIPVLGSVFGEPVSNGRTFMTAGLIVAIMIVPIITSITREVFSTVPALDKQAALRARRHPLGDDQGRGVPAQLRRHGRCGRCSASAGRWARPSRSRWSSAPPIQITAEHVRLGRRDAVDHRAPVGRVERRPHRRPGRAGRGAVRHHDPRQLRSRGSSCAAPRLRMRGAVA